MFLVIVICSAYLLSHKLRGDYHVAVTTLESERRPRSWVAFVCLALVIRMQKGTRMLRG
jgi:hypothetical protein